MIQTWSPAAPGRDQAATRGCSSCFASCTAERALNISKIGHRLLQAARAALAAPPGAALGIAQHQRVVRCRCAAVAAVRPLLHAPTAGSADLLLCRHQADTLPSCFCLLQASGICGQGNYRSSGTAGSGRRRLLSGREINHASCTISMCRTAALPGPSHQPRRPSIVTLLSCSKIACRDGSPTFCSPWFLAVLSIRDF